MKKTVKKQATYKQFCQLLQKYVQNVVEEEERQDLYTDFKSTGNKPEGFYWSSMTEFIIVRFGMNKPHTHHNYLKRNGNK